LLLFPAGTDLEPAWFLKFLPDFAYALAIGVQEDIVMRKAKNGKLVTAAGREWAKHLRADGKKAVNRAERRHAKVIVQEG